MGRMMPKLYDVQAHWQGRTSTDLVTGSRRRALERRDEINNSGKGWARVVDARGETVEP